MKVKIYFNGRFLSQSITGVQRTAYELMLAFDSLIEQHLIDTDKYDFFLIHPHLNSLPIELKHITLLQKGRLKGNLWEQFELPYYTRGGFLVSMCMIAPLLKRKQTVIIHDAACFAKPEFFSKAFRSWYKFAIPVLCKIAMHIITVSEFSKRELERYVKIKPHKVSVIANAADHILKYSEPDDDFKEKITALKPYILAVSSLNPNKNFEGLISAAKQIKNFKHNLLIAGAMQISSFKSTNVDKFGAYLGYVSNSELKYLYSNASLFVFPSFYEGFGIPPLEAMMLKCPVLAANTGALPEVLDTGCKYCDPYSILDMKIRLEELMHDDITLSGLRSSGHEIAKNYSWYTSAEKLYQVIKQYAD